MTCSARVWLADGSAVGDAALARFAGWLSAGEAGRHARFLRPARQRQFLLGRVLLRHAIGTLAGAPARSVVLEERAGQAPLLTVPAIPGLGLSISHSGNWIACALGDGVAVGLDIEVADPARDVLALADQAFGARVATWLAARPAECRVRDFYDVWSENEARIKLGAGADDAPCFRLDHPVLSIALCCARAPERAPALTLANLALC